MSNDDIAERQRLALDRLMLCRRELLKVSTDALLTVGEIDETVSLNLRRIGSAPPENIVTELECMAAKAGNAL